jgi:hypothetical protein
VTGLWELDYYPVIGVDCQDRAVPGPVVTKLPKTFPARYRAALLLPLCVLLLGGCWNGRVLFSFERPFWSSLGDDTRLQTALAGEAARRGYMPRFEIGAGAIDPLKTLQATAASGRYSVVVVGPLLSFDWASYVPSTPRTRFILVDAPVPAQGPPANAVFLTFNRTAAFREAGKVAAASVRTQLGSTGAAVPGSELGPRIAVLRSDDAGLAGEEMDAFMNGAAGALDGSMPVMRQLTAPVDRAAVRSAIDQMQRAGTLVFLLGLGEHDGLALEALFDAGGVAVVSDWQASGAFPDQVLASVEDDVPGGITRALDALRAGTALADGPVRLVIGKRFDKGDSGKYNFR